jgi:hypothetical protein
MDMDKLFESASLDGIADNVFGVVNNSVSEVKEMQRKKVAENVQLVVDALKKIESNISSRYDLIGNTLEKRILTIKDGRDGIHGRDGRNGKDGKNGRDGLPGPRGADGKPGRDGADGSDGVSVTDAKIDFDGSLIISLSSGREINVGEVVAPALAEQIKVITNGGGTSQSVIDTLASLQAQITALSGAVIYKGLWNALTNTPTLTSSVGTSGNFYIVSVAGSTSLDGITNWGVGDWAIFNGTAWQRVEGGAAGNFTTVTASGTITAGDTLSMSKVGVAGQGGQVANTNTAAGAWASWRVSNGARALHLTTTSTGWSGTHLTGGPTSEQSAIYTDGAIPLVFGVSNTMVGQFTSTGLAVTGTLSATGAVTLSGGTANGVAYLDGSKVLTTGSALTFDGTNFTSPRAQFTTAGTPPASGAGIEVVGGTSPVILAYNRGTSAYLPFTQYGSAFTWSINGSSSDLVLTSTGLGIGTSSPAVRCDIQGVGGSLYGVNPPLQVWDTQALAADIGGGIAFGGNFSGSSKTSWAGIAGLKDNATSGNYAGYLAFYTRPNGANKTEVMRLDSSGNLLVGVTSANANGGVLQLKSGITFPATQVAASDANTLDDYEEGTWTPSIGGTATYTAQQGTYRKVGSVVFYTAYVQINALGTGTTAYISGLPFATATTSNWVGGAAASTAATNIVSIYCTVVGTSINLYSRTAASASPAINTIWQNSALVEVNGFYFV